MRSTLRSICRHAPRTKFIECYPRFCRLSTWFARRIGDEHHGAFGKDVFPAVPEIVAHQNILGPLLSSVDEVFLADLISSIAEAIRTGVKAMDHQCPPWRPFPVLAYAI